MILVFRDGREIRGKRGFKEFWFYEPMFSYCVTVTSDNGFNLIPGSIVIVPRSSIAYALFEGKTK